ncbi:MAG: hypothetical protein WA908_03145, partial [Pontixanthobacter sp.]
LGLFDAIIGRRVLMYLPDASQTLARLVTLAKPAAVFAFQEHSRANLPSGLGSLPCHNQLYRWVWDTVAAEGGDVGLGMRLRSLIQSTGCQIEDARNEGVLLHHDEASFLPTLMRGMLPRMIEHRIVKAGEIKEDEFAQELEKERFSAGGSIVWDMAFLVSGRLDAG